MPTNGQVTLKVQKNGTFIIDIFGSFIIEKILWAPEILRPSGLAQPRRAMGRPWN